MVLLLEMMVYPSFAGVVSGSCLLVSSSAAAFGMVKK